MKREKPESDPLPSKSSIGELVGGFLAGLDHALTARPEPPAEVEEQYREPWASAEGVKVEGLEEPMERPESPDRSGATL
jgi:hypothetical protein